MQKQSMQLNDIFNIRKANMTARLTFLKKHANYLPEGEVYESINLLEQADYEEPTSLRHFMEIRRTETKESSEMAIISLADDS